MSTKNANRRNIALSVGLLIATAIGLGTVATGAVFADTETAGGASFVTGTVEIGASPVAAALNVPNMAPGDAVTAPIEVSNTGTLAERYALVAKTDSAASDALAGQLVLTVKTGVECTSAAFATGGTVLYSGPLASSTGLKVLGDSAVGAQAGDRTLNAGAAETLCTNVALPKASGNEFAAKSAKASLVFNAEQVVNNP